LTKHRLITPTGLLQELLKRYRLPIQVNHRKHWLLSYATGRELLKLAARKADPTFPLLSEPLDADERLEIYIDQLALRDLSQPRSASEDIAMQVLLIKIEMKVLFSKGWNF
jgi:hypothetical protein